MAGRWKKSYGTCGAKTRRGTPCQCMSVNPGGRCRLHGGLSTGPRTPEGRFRSLRALPSFKHRSDAEVWKMAQEVFGLTDEEKRRRAEDAR
jgi:hypothetical protein